MVKPAAIGIDLGTTYSCVAVVYKGQVKILENKEGGKTTPSIVAFTDVERLIGNNAKNQMGINPQNTVFDAKRMIGKNFDDPLVQSDREIWPFNIVSTRGKLKIEVTHKEEKRQFFPEQISSMVLTAMKESAETFLGYKVTDAVITVPAYFNDAQRQATKDAGTIAGLNVLRIINEPTAAAIAFGYDEREEGKRQKILVFDLGGGTFDISILLIEDGVFTVIAVAGDSHLGGQDFDIRMAKHFAAEFERKHKQNMWNDKRSRTKLLMACENAKRILSSGKEALISIDSLFGGIDFQSKVTQARFNDINAELFNKTIELVSKALNDSNLSKEDIDDVVLVGGSTRIPRVRELLKEYFRGKVLNQKVNADEAVAYGAAIQASILNGDYSLNQNIQLLDVIPQSLGIRIIGNRMSIVIRRNTSIPVKTTKIFETSEDNQTAVCFAVFEGEHPTASDNNWLGEFKITEIPAKKQGEEKFNVTFDIDANGILNVTAVNISTGKSNNIIINKERLDADDMKSVIEQIKKFRIEDEQNEKSVTAKNSLETYCHKVKLIVEELKHKIHQTERATILAKCDEILQWMDDTVRANASEYESKEKEIKTLSEKIFHKNVTTLFGSDDIPD